MPPARISGPNSVTPEQLERIKLEDGIHCHENTKAELDIYARSTGRPKVHPFMLVVAQDTTHAEDLRQIIEVRELFRRQVQGPRDPGRQCYPR